MTNMNHRAFEMAMKMAADFEALNIRAERLECGATVIDAGVNVGGSLEAGRLFGEICMSGLGKIEFCDLQYNEFSTPGVKVTSDSPVMACMGSQYAGWAIKVDRDRKKPFQAMGSGPARILYHREELLKDLGISEKADKAVLLLESRKLPDNEVAVWVAETCGVSPENTVILVAPTASIVGSVQIAARIVETGLHKMHEVEFDINKVISGTGVCPVAPVAEDDLMAIGKTNDAVLFGGRVWYKAESGPEAIEKVIEKLPSSASDDYGAPFFELFRASGYDFYKIDPMLFSPAEITIEDTISGRTFHAGKADPNLLKKGLFS